MSQLDAIESKPLFVPPAGELAKVLKDCLSKNFKEVEVTVGPSPDLTKSPYNLACPGLCGHPRLVDVGGVPYLIPLPQSGVDFDLRRIAERIGLPNAFFIGAGAGATDYVGINCELMTNASVGASERLQSKCAYVENDECRLKDYTTTRFSLLANLLACDGAPGDVLRITAKGRTGDENFVTCMRKGLVAAYPGKHVGLGGAFVIRRGTAHLHVMPHFSETPLNSDEDVHNWLKFYDFPSPLTCLSVFVNDDMGLDLRVEHTHCFSEQGTGGHYHYDTTPTDVEYEAYYVAGEHMFRVGRPQASHNVGRD
eukprot:Opistho-1_new@106799